MPFYMGTKVQKKVVILCKAELIVCEIIINNDYWKCHLAPQNVVGRENALSSDTGMERSFSVYEKFK